MDVSEGNFGASNSAQADSTRTGLGVGRLVWDQDTGRFNSYVLDAKGLTASQRLGNQLPDARRGMVQSGSTTGS